jgi:DNA-binding winged helix-turn-helix (wHTH) protein
VSPLRFRFDRFLLDPRDRRLTRDGAPVELNARYLDALILLVSEQGRLVSKERFLDEVWRGVPVTDEALTQCVRTLRRRLGDDAARPRFIETAPKHGYRFIATVEAVETAATVEAAPTAPREVTPATVAQTLAPVRSEPWRRLLRLGGAGTLGGAVAGLIGGLIYGAVAAAPGVGAVSVLLVLVCLTALVALVGGAGVSFGVAATAAVRGRLGSGAVLGGAGGGLVVGGLVKLVSLDAFTLLFGRSPGDMTGAPEGALLGAAVGLGAWLAGRMKGSLRRRAAVAGLCGAVGGALIPLFGGRMMAGSLALLPRVFPDSHLKLDAFGRLMGEPGFGPASGVLTGALEGLLFGACVVGAMLLAERKAE